MEIEIRKLRIEDLEEYKYWQLPIHKYHEYNGPFGILREEWEIMG